MSSDSPSSNIPFYERVNKLVNEDDVDVIIESQAAMLARFEKTNEMLVNCSALAMGRYESVAKRLKSDAKLLAEMKKDIDYIFKKIRAIKAKFIEVYPNAFKALENKSNTLVEEAEEEETA